MGIDLYCNNKSFFTSYSGWNEIRVNIITITFKYIQKKFLEDNYKNNLDEYDEDIVDSSSYWYYMNAIKELIDELNEINNTKDSLSEVKIDNTITIFTRLCHNLNIMNAFNYFEIGGLIALCRQNDCDGYYTPGNSLDICILFDIIKDTVMMHNIFIYDFIYTSKNNLYDLFQESYTTVNKVIIS
jgi:hypothetical protein